MAVALAAVHVCVHVQEGACTRAPDRRHRRRTARFAPRSGPGDSGLPWRVTAGVLLTRLVLVPLVLTGVVAGALALRLFVPPDPMFLLTMLLANATPSAINLQTVTVLYNHGAAEMSQLLFWQYLAAVATLPAFTALFLCMIEAFVPG